jgi:hypothetical protein
MTNHFFLLGKIMENSVVRYYRVTKRRKNETRKKEQNKITLRTVGNTNRGRKKQILGRTMTFTFNIYSPSINMWGLLSPP